MTTEDNSGAVTELADSEIAPPDGSGVAIDTNPALAPEPEPMSEVQQAGVGHLQELRAMIAAEPDRATKESMMQRLSELTQFVFNGAPAPAWYSEKPEIDPRATDTRPADINRDMAESLQKELEQPLSDEQVADLRNYALVQGLEPQRANDATNFATAAGLDPESAKVITRAFAKYEPQGIGFDKQLTDEQMRSLAQSAAKHFGGVEQVLAVSGLARAWVESKGLGPFVDEHGGALGFDPEVLQVLAFRARLAGLKPVK